MASKKLLSIAHSYAVALNRRLVNEIALAGKGEWEVTAVAPTFIYGDLRPIHLEIDPKEICNLEAVPIYFSKYPHIMLYGWRLKKLLEQSWDLVHCWQEPYTFLGGQIAYWKPQSTPLVYFSFQNNNKNYPPPFNKIEQYSMHRAAGWISAGQTITEALKSRPGYNRPTRLIPTGVDTQHFYPCPEVGLKVLQALGWAESDAPVVGYLGRFVPEKGLDLLMSVLDELKTPWRALFVGGGLMEAQLRDWAKKYPQQVRVCTGIQHSDVPQYLNAMDILCAPSQTTKNWREQFGRMLIEAFACGVPVIGSDSGEIPYVIGDAGVIVREQNQAGWVQALSDLLESPEQRQILAEKGLWRSRTYYAWPIVAQQYLDFFTELS